MKRLQKTKTPTLKRGDEVTWTSQASGYSKKKTGKIVEVVVARDYPRRAPHDNRLGWSKPRDHRSYLVEVDGKLYWPLVKYLRKVGGR